MDPSISDEELARLASASQNRDGLSPEIAALTADAAIDYFFHTKVVCGGHVPEPNAKNISAADAVLARTFEFVGESYSVPAGFSWKINPSADKEWQIAQHKHYFAIDLCQAWRLTSDRRYLDGWSELMTSWLDEMGTGFIRSSDAQVEAKRVESWTTAFLVLHRAATRPPLDGALVKRLVGRIGEEVRYIAQNLRPARNHRTFQLFAIVLATTVFPEIDTGTNLSEPSRELLVSNLMDDFTPEGVHVERSTHYHNITLETALAFAELAAANSLELPGSLHDRLKAALEFSLYAQLPDGEIPLVGDSDTAEHRTMFETAFRLYGDPRYQWAASLGETGLPLDLYSREFGGYFILNDSLERGRRACHNRQHIFYDCAPLGVGSHSHYDLFSFCWSARGRQIIVDPGRYTYNADPGSDGRDWRYEFKRTAAHNTIVIDGLDQTRYLSKSMTPAAGLERYDRTRHPQKHGPAVQIRNKRQHLGRVTDWVMATAASHEYTPLHTRALFFMKRDYVLILDRVEMSDGQLHSCDLRLHLAADWLDGVTLSAIRGGAALASSHWSGAIICDAGAADRKVGDGVTLEEGWVSKSYGSRHRAPVISATSSGKGVINYCTALIASPDDEARLELSDLSWVTSRDNGQTEVVVELTSRNRQLRDRFMIQPDGLGMMEIDGASYRGALAAFRCEQGRLSHAVAAPSHHCRLGPLDLSSHSGPIEF